MGAKNNTKRKGKSKGGGKPRAGGGVRNDFRDADFQHSQVQGSGTMQTFVQQYAPVPTATDSLPQLPADFTGRDDDVDFLLGVLDPDHTDGLPSHAVLSGWGGVGKTTLVHAAGHAAFKRGWFTGVLLVNLRGYDLHPSQAEDALEALLRSLGLRPEHIPPPGGEREALYRSQLAARERAGERLLVIADNASRADQVQPLLPPGHHGLLATSRRSLPGLGRMRTVHLLQPEDAVALLRAALRRNNPDDHRVDEEPEAAQQVAVACGCLPLALQITAGLLASDPGQPLAERAERLTSAGRLEGIDDGERSLRATFDQSLESLSLQQAELFRLLSLNPGPDISTTAAIILTEQSQVATENLLGQLASAHLIERGTVRGRWQMHDLLREYAHEQATAQCERSRPSRRRYDQARTRLTDYYVRTTEAANTHLQPPGRTVVAPVFSDQEQALAWLDAERENLIATAHAEGTTQAATRLGFSLGSYLLQRRRLQDLLRIRSLALDACTAQGDGSNEAGAWSNLGNTLREMRRFDEAIDAHQKALTLFQQHADTRSEAGAWNNLGSTLQEVRRFDEAIDAHQKALTLHQQHADTRSEAGAWNNLGNDLQEVRRFDEAIDAHQKALTLHQQHADTHNEARAWNNLGTDLREMRRFDEAIDAHQKALTLFQQHADTHNEARAWNNLGTDLREMRRFDEAIDAHQKALTLFQQHADTHNEARAWNNLGTALQEVRRFDEAIDAHQKALTLFQQHADTHNEAGAWNNLGTALQEVRRFDETIDAHQKALTLFQQHADTHNEAGAWNNLGTALQEVRRFDETIDAHQKALTLFQQHADTHNEAGAWNNLGTALQEVRRFDEAIDAHQKALTLFQQHADTHNEAGAWNNLGTDLREMRRFDEAIDAHQKALTLFQQHADTHNEARAWNNLGTDLREMRRFDEAIDAGKRAAAMLAEAGDWFHTGEAWEELATTLDAAGADPARIKDAWERSATAYTQAGAAEEAETSRAHTNDPPPPQSSDE